MASAQRAAGFDMDIRYHNRSERIGIPYGYEASLIDLASWADFLMIATVGGDSTRGLVNAEVLKALGPNGIVVNIARGSVIDETALVKRSEEHTSELQSLMRISYAVFCLKKKKTKK